MNALDGDRRSRPRIGLRKRLGDRAHHRGIHGHRHVANQRRTALIMIVTGLVRVLIWTLIMIAFVAGQPTVAHWFGSVKFVSLLSILALVLTDWGQVAASLAQLTAGDAHQDAEHNRRALGSDFALLESDVARLADLHPGREAHALAEQICRRIREPDSESLKTRG